MIEKEQMQDLEDHTGPSPRSRTITAAFFPVLGVILLWCIHLLGTAFELPLWKFGVLPRTLIGAVGIVTAPFVHGGYDHLFNNSVPLLILGWCLVYFYPRVAWRVLLGVWLLTGLWVWISARGDRHIGISGVVYGLAAFLFFSGVIRRQRALMALSLLVVFLYGGLVWGVLPLAPRVSWESHLWGGIAGVAMAILYRNTAPAYLREPVLLEEDDGELTHPHQGPNYSITYHYGTALPTDDPEDAADPRSASSNSTGPVEPFR